MVLNLSSWGPEFKFRSENEALSLILSTGTGHATYRLHVQKFLLKWLKDCFGINSESERGKELNI